jgi:serine/threonine protein kinase
MENVGERDLFAFFFKWNASVKELEKKGSSSGRVAAVAARLNVAKQLARQLFEGLAKLHGAGVMHLDLKPENIALDEDDISGRGSRWAAPSTKSVPMTTLPRMKIIDFDTIELYKPGKKTQYVLGTDQYIPPETYAGQPTPESDVWAAGVILYVFLTGCFPFQSALFDDLPGENIVGHAKMEKIRRRLLLSKIQYDQKVFTMHDEARMAKDFVSRCFARDPTNRLRAHEALTHPWLS